MRQGELSLGLEPVAGDGSRGGHLAQEPATCRYCGKTVDRGAIGSRFMGSGEWAHTPCFEAAATREKADREERGRTAGEARELAARGLPEKWLARRSDPATSKEAAEILGHRPSTRVRLLAAMLHLERATVAEACRAAGYGPASGAWKRFSELKRLGLVAGTGETVEGESGWQVEVYEVTG